MAADLIKKLRLDKAKKILILNAPPEYIKAIKGIEFDSKPSLSKSAQFDFVQIFATTQADMEKLIQKNLSLGVEDCLFWACYPKGTGKIKSDIKRETLWTAFAKVGMDSVASISIDETWTALRARPAHKVGK